jgi:hypothetical protein
MQFYTVVKIFMEICLTCNYVGRHDQNRSITRADFGLLFFFFFIIYSTTLSEFHTCIAWMINYKECESYWLLTQLMYCYCIKRLRNITENFPGYSTFGPKFEFSAIRIPSSNSTFGPKFEFEAGVKFEFEAGILTAEKPRLVITYFSMFVASFFNSTLKEGS